MTLTYTQALDYIFDFVNFELRVHYKYDHETFNLQRMADVLARLGNPHRQYRVVHITGSRGKGSTAAMMERCLREAGYRTGLYTSPHLHTFRERMRVDGRLIAQSDVAALVERCRPAIEATPGLTTFEIITTLAFVFFAQQGVEWAVVEVGLGGRLDSTNVVMPDACAITSISYDHTTILGNTLAMIAREKAGIIKPGVPIVCGPVVDEALNVIASVAADRQAPLTLVGRDWLWREAHTDLHGQSFDAWPVAQDGRNGQATLAGHFWIPLLGKHQLTNATAVLALVEQLRRRGVVLPTDAVCRGLYHVRWPGRLEPLVTLADAPAIVVDGAQNRDSALKLREALQTWFAGHRLVLVFGVSSDHDFVGMWDELFPGCDAVVLTASQHPRAARPGALAEQARQHPACPARLEVMPTVDDALQAALRLVDSVAGLSDAPPMIVLTGSLFVVAEAREAWARRFPAAFAPDDWVHQTEPLKLTVR